MELLQKTLRLDRAALEKLQANNWILAYSGGADSALVLQLLLELHKNSPRKRRLVIYHLDHGENQGLKSISQRKKIMAGHLQEARNLDLLTTELTVYKRPVSAIARKSGGSFEYTGARLRKKHLLRLKKKEPGSLILTGHTLSDWYETLIMRVNRGASPSALYPFDFSRQEGSNAWGCPLYMSTRNEVRALCQKLHLLWWDDPANTEGTNRRSKVRDRFLIFHPDGLRKSAALFLEQKEQEEKAKTRLSDQLKSSLITIAPHREYRLQADFMRSLERTDREQVAGKILQELGLWPLSMAVRRELEFVPFRYGPFHVELENWHDMHFFVFRRGRTRLLHNKIQNTSFVRGDQITKSYFILLDYGKKSVKKILSEKRLSLRQRKNLFLPLREKDSLQVNCIDLTPFGLKKIDQTSF